MLIRFKNIDRLVGIFVIVVIFILIVLLSSIGLNKEWFTPKKYFYTIIDRTMGIRSGTKVLISGMETGQVTDVLFNEQNKIQITFYIKKAHERLVRSDTRVIVKNPTLIGRNLLELTIGSPREPLMQEKNEIPGEIYGGLSELIEKLAVSDILQLINQSFMKFQDMTGTAKDSFVKLSNTLNYADDDFVEFKTTIENIDRLVATMKDENNSIGKLLNDRGKIYKNVEGASADMKEVAHALNTSKDKMLHDVDTIIADLKVLLTKFNTVGDDVSKASPRIPQLLNEFEKVALEAKKVLQALERHWLLRKYVEEE